MQENNAVMLHFYPLASLKLRSNKKCLQLLQVHLQQLIVL